MEQFPRVGYARVGDVARVITGTDVRIRRVSISVGIRKWCPAAQDVATCATGPSVLGSENRSVISAGTPHSGQEMTVSIGYSSL